MQNDTSLSAPEVLSYFSRLVGAFMRGFAYGCGVVIPVLGVLCVVSGIAIVFGGATVVDARGQEESSVRSRFFGLTIPQTDYHIQGVQFTEECGDVSVSRGVVSTKYCGVSRGIPHMLRRKGFNHMGPPTPVQNQDFAVPVEDGSYSNPVALFLDVASLATIDVLTLHRNKHAPCLALSQSVLAVPEFDGSSMSVYNLASFGIDSRVWASDWSWDVDIGMELHGIQGCSMLGETGAIALLYQFKRSDAANLVIQRVWDGSVIYAATVKPVFFPCEIEGLSWNADKSEFRFHSILAGFFVFEHYISIPFNWTLQ